MQHVLWGCLATFFLKESKLSYEVIARKWRPKSFQELIGQNHISQTLTNALRNKRLPHALLFTGPRGTGKTSSARILAKSMRCPNAVDFTPCNECSDCQDISSGRSLDVHELDGASNNGIDAIRELQENVRSMPSSGSHKLYIIDEVHMLSLSAFNALLKTLEEPPGHVIFVLATTEVQKIPDTILSRCQRFDFRRIPLSQVTESLKKICDAENIKADESSLWMIAKQGEGSMRDSQSLLDQVIAFTNGDLSGEKVVDVLGLTDRSLLFDTIKALATRDSSGVLQAIDKISVTGNDPKIFVEDLLQEFRNLVLVKVSSDKGSATKNLLDLPESDVDSLKDIAMEISQEDIHLLFDMTLKGANEMVHSSRPSLVLEMLLLRMVEAPMIQSLAEVLQANSSGTGSSSQAPKKSAPVRKATQSSRSLKTEQSYQKPIESKSRAIQSPPPQTSTPAQKTDVPERTIYDSNLDLASNWLNFVKKLGAVDKKTSVQLENTQLSNLNNDDKKLTLSVHSNLQFLYDQLKNERFQKTLQVHLLNFWKEKFIIEILLISENVSQSPRELGEQKKQSHEQEIRKKIEDHPLVKSTKEKLNVKIDSIKESS